MPEIISAALTFGLVAFRASGARSSGVSDEAKDVEQRITAIYVQADESIVYSDKRHGVIDNLNNQLIEYLNTEWDGQGASPVSWTSYKNAKDFIRMLPSTIANPDVSIEPGGSAISLEWYYDRRKLFAVSIGSTHRFAFSGLNGPNKIYGVTEFAGTDGGVPAVLLSEVKALSR